LKTAILELDGVSLACLQSALNLALMQTQATLADVQQQLQAQLDAEAAKPARTP
jgi:hypothetical protein